MARTGAERQAAFRERRDARRSDLQGENERLRAAVAGLEGRIAWLESECGRLAEAACGHPAMAVRGGTCLACGSEVW